MNISNAHFAQGLAEAETQAEAETESNGFKHWQHGINAKYE